MKCRNNGLFGLLKAREGSYSLEAALVFPVILLATFLVLFFALYIGQRALVYYGASIAGERAAFNWSNSAKDPRTGYYPEGSYDGLYWRLGDDAVLAGLFGTGASEETSGEEGTAADEASPEAGSLTGRKLREAADTMSLVADGRMSYENKLLYRLVRAEAELPAGPEPLARFRGTTAGRAAPFAVVVEPAEFVRTFDLVRYYAAKMKGSSDGGQSIRAKAMAVLTSRKAGS